MFCRRCGAQIPEDSTFCTRCGTPIGMAGASDTPTIPGGHVAPPPAGEQFVPPPPWQPPTPGGAYPGGPTNFGPRPPSPPITQLIFGPTPPPGAPLIHHRWIQRRLLSSLQPPTAGNIWLGAVFGSLIAFALVLLLSIAFSLTLGPTLDQSSFGAFSTGQVGNSGGVAGSDSSFSVYSNPLIVLAYAHRTTINEKVTLGVAGTTQSVSASVTLPITLLLLLPAISLMIGGYFAASTNYSSRRLFSITRGASIGMLYALLLLLVSLVTSTNANINVGSTNASESLSISPDAISALFSGLLCGVIFGALGGALQSRSIPLMTPTRPVSRAWTRMRGALIGAVWALVLYFILCLILVIALYAAAQFGGPVLQGEGSPSFNGSSSTCHVFLKQPDPSAQPSIKANFPIHVFYAIYSPALAQWVMTISMGAPLQVSASGLTIDFGLFNADCQPGPKGTLLYLFLLLPAISVFAGGWIAARSAQPSTAKEATGIGLLLAPAFAILFLFLSLLAAINETASLGGLGTTINFGAAIGWTLLAGFIFGGIFGILGSLAGRPRHLPPLPATPTPGRPAAPGAWPPAAPPPAQPSVSSAVASFHPAPLEPAPGGPGDQPPDKPASSAPPDTTLPPEEPQT